VTVARTIVALDGHDGAGKTTLARRLASALGGVHVRPFAGAAGARLVSLATVDPEAAARFGWDAIAAAEAAAPGDLLVFDRHWMTICSLLPAPCRPAVAMPPTALCWAALAPTLARLAARGDRDGAVPVAEHERYLAIYADLGRRFGCLVLRTDRESEDESLARLAAWAAGRAA
jgi:hypothetical protein